MRTPKSYTENLKKGIITKEMLGDCLFSCNKRAKNMRDQERSYRGYYGFDYEEQYREKKQEYYDKKEKLLSIINPVCIHEEHQKGQHIVQIDDYEPEYDKIYYSGQYVRSGEYYNRDSGEYVSYVKIMEEHENINYYLFYDMGEHSFHTPIEEYEIDKMKEKYGVDVVAIDTITTFGKEINDLISVQFVEKVLDLIATEKYILEMA